MSITPSHTCLLRGGQERLEPPDARPSPHRRIDHPHSHPGKRISIWCRRFLPRVPERWADVKAGFVHRGARRACRPRTQRWSGWVVEEVVVVGVTCVARSARHGESGGGRAGRASGIVCGSPRCRKNRAITTGSSINAISVRRPPHRGQASTSRPRL